jgi:DNA-directed RNA polymerase subunit M/transcription elongation factor TFIIS
MEKLDSKFAFSNGSTCTATARRCTTARGPSGARRTRGAPWTASSRGRSSGRSAFVVCVAVAFCFWQKIILFFFPNHRRAKVLYFTQSSTTATLKHEPAQDTLMATKQHRLVEVAGADDVANVVVVACRLESHSRNFTCDNNFTVFYVISTRNLDQPMVCCHECVLCGFISVSSTRKVQGGGGVHTPTFIYNPQTNATGWKMEAPARHTSISISSEEASSSIVTSERI